ncbi:hypothetical protein [Crateriforma spongiae]|uniref:hypothetical protein n=1 Tax=Crateriforma spongiae TaxID=2724528 RepID=UPI00144728EF|nr:hypothetical protein [Crateriforma spongiae]
MSSRPSLPPTSTPRASTDGRAVTDQAVTGGAADRPVAASIDRRRFAIATAAMAAACIGRTSDAAPASKTGRVSLVENPDLDLFRVRLAINVQGNVNLPSDPLVSKRSMTKLPIQSDAVFDYEERYRWPTDAKPGSPVMGLERYYHEAVSSGTLSKNDISFGLRPTVRQTLVRRDMLPETIYCGDDYLTHEELGLIRTPVSAVQLGDLLPLTAVAKGDQYEVNRGTIGNLLNLSSVDDGKVENKIEDIDDAIAKITMSGKIDGSIDGVPTLVRLVGKMTFDRKQNVCNWLALALHETRDIGKAEPGFDVQAKIRMIRQPMPRPAGLPAKPVAMDLTRPVPGNQTLVLLHSDALSVTALMDRRWRMISDRPGAAMMRMIDQESSMGQCNLKPLVRLPEGKTWTLAQLQQDVRRSLGDRMTRFLRDDRMTSPGGIETMQLIAAGTVEGVEVRWIVQHHAAPSGRRLLATFTTDADSFDAMAGSEVQLASTLEFVAPVPTGDAEDDAKADQSGDVTLAAPEPATKVADAGAADSLSSASDLR